MRNTKAKAMFLAILIQKFLSDNTRKILERIILVIAISSFVIHLLLILLSNNGWLPFESALFESPISAIYTPFSFILIYEVYLLIFYLPRSITTYIGKQYEIITLIIIRRLFKDLGSLELSSNWFELKNDLQFTYDLLTSILLFYLIFLFQKQSSIRRKQLPKKDNTEDTLQFFIQFKKTIAAILIPTLFISAFYLFLRWTFEVVGILESSGNFIKNINNVFFDEFFTILIVVDVVLLLASFFYSDQFHKVIRNSGFVISTILIRISFSVEGVMNNTLILIAVLFGLLMLTIHNKFEQTVSQE